MANEAKLILVDRIEPLIRTIRGQNVILDADLAKLYGVAPKRLNEQVRRNQDRFPGDFVFQLTREEAASLRSQIATLKAGRGRHRKYSPYAFTEHGTAALPLPPVLRGERAGVRGDDIPRETRFLQGIQSPSPPAPLPRSTGGEGSKRLPHGAEE